MLARPEPACLVIADISGYTGYLAGVELDHAQDVLADLMSTVVSALRPTFRLAKLEGDAAFVYLFTERVDGSHLQDTVERCYFAFRRRLRDIRQSSSCECNACLLIPRLNLKVVAHHGAVARQRIAGRDELVGSPVVVVHRLLKSSVEESLGLAAYAMYSAACIAAMGADPAVIGLREHRETYEGVGEIVGWVADLEAAWAAEQQRARVTVEPAKALWQHESFYPAPPEVVWDWVTSPIRRPLWQPNVLAVDESSPSGRRGIGTTNHCVHGRDAVVEEVLDWRPFDYLTTRSQLPAQGVPKLTMTQRFEAVDGGTRVRAAVARISGAKGRLMGPQIAAEMERLFLQAETTLGPLIEADLDARREAASVAEPVVPTSSGRNLREPVQAGATSGRPAVDSGRARSSP
ncbi:MAG TPA: DUF2652 domain-containing protein [Candidatus Limnocylindrales bacterium]|nr:DUF2652 domain-containing protein [Candidatus Limnocylindrales bacterium]